MQYLITPYSEPSPPYVWWGNAFNDQQLDWLQSLAIKSTEKAVVTGDFDDKELLKIRRSNINWLECNNETEWIFKNLSHIVSTLNSQFYRFDLTGFGEALQLTNYSESENGMYGWHQDCGGTLGVSRKLSLVLQLTDPSEYEGGNLQIRTSIQPQNVKKQRGLIAVFPSYNLHQVTPVTKGSRQSLVAWISGPAFK